MLNMKIKNSTKFSNYIRNVTIKDDEIMVSFGLTSWYTNIPIIDTLKIIKELNKIMDYVNNYSQLNRRILALLQDKFLDLVNLI